MKYSTHAKRQLEKEDQELVIRTIIGIGRIGI